MEEPLFVVFLVVAVVVLLARALAGRLGVPDAILLVLLGMAAGFVPALPAVVVPPELVLLGFLPPLIYHAAFFTAPREARADAVPIVALAFGLTTLTTLAVAATVTALLPGVGWAAALAFGAAVSPTDPVAATSVMQRLGAPPRMVTILEGESLINDGAALTIFVLAVEAMSTEFTLADGVGRTVQYVAGGLAYGFVLGAVMRRVRRRIRDPVSQVIVSLMTPYLAFVPAEHAGASGVLATVVTGFTIGTHGEGVLQPASRLVGTTFWRILTFLLESTLFVLLGLEIREIVREPGGRTWGMVAATAPTVAAVVIGVRLLWELGYGPLALIAPNRRGQRGLGWRQRVVLGFGGMRGAITLAIALSLPTAAGPQRGLLVLLAALVVLVTLIGQAPLLPVLLRRLGLIESDRRRTETMRARQAGLRAALARLDELAEDDDVDAQTADAFRQMLELRLDRVRYYLAEEDGTGDGDAGTAGPPPNSRRVRAELVRAQRAKLTTMYRRGKIGAETLREISRELDFEDPIVIRKARS
ncbi:Na+/H+ antiporter [Actinomadura algeriensis]|uniref:CPA1 family monovalent cation:H+ antiporter n=1 Tax=Actinomadura algeriensis TaxID=1679523 RepID=A0ABR9JZ62_9ACTN|nr:Na+/H+ antiporter [Actinomadura algeriensis]MBE1535865.1 CPA1 family monovalent cation:H+ antiporter [Actinomadura algeriensis]